jgi:hypothetical protein
LAFIVDHLSGERCGLRHVDPRPQTDTLTSLTVSARQSKVLRRALLDFAISYQFAVKYQRKYPRSTASFQLIASETTVECSVRYRRSL